jgi:hypothetical protein
VNETVLVGKHERKIPTEILTVGGTIALMWIVTKQDVRLWTGFIWLRILSTSGPL